MVEQENKLTLDVLPLEAGGVQLVRVYGTDPCVRLPDALPGLQGGAVHITGLGDYCFSEKARRRCALPL